jgi:hypothetical protein
MKTCTFKLSFLITFFAIGAYVMAQMPAAISIEPSNATAMDEITLTLDISEACFQSASLEGVDTVRMHGGIGFDDGTTWQFVIDWNLHGADGTTNALIPNGDGTYSMTFTPKTYFGVPDTSLAITQLCCVFNDGTWDKDGRDFNDDMTACQDFFIPLGISGINSKPEISFNMFPNPVGDMLTIDHLKSASKIEVFNMVGQMVLSTDHTQTGKITFNTSGLNKGIYMINVYSNGTVSSAKFMKK